MLQLTRAALSTLAMRIVGRHRLQKAMDAGDVPAGAARAWLAEAQEARWAKLSDVLERYKDAETVKAAEILVPIDAAGHCVVFVVEYRCRLVVIVFAGLRGGYSMRKRRIDRKS
jgi:mRNA-degrading endonuclease HigB of HigAB toxin-antitoxin module